DTRVRPIITAELRRGADVRYRIIPPGGHLHDPRIPFQVLREGQPIETYLYGSDVTNLVRSLPLGRYRFLVQSTSEQRNRFRSPNEIVPKVRGYRAAEIPFIVDAASPTLIDLGDIRLASE